MSGMVKYVSNQQLVPPRTDLENTILPLPLLYGARVNDVTHSIPIPLDPQAPKPLPQFPGPARAPMDSLLPICVLLPVTHGPRLAFNAHRSPLGGGCGHLNGLVAVGCVSGVGFVLLEGFFEGVGGLAFAFEVFG